jgi:C4-dicarboxylate-specific signal transduction histidine kinase
LLYSVTQAELANMTRVMTMGALTASIAHEVNQPLSGMITYAGSCSQFRSWPNARQSEIILEPHLSGV